MMTLLTGRRQPSLLPETRSTNERFEMIERSQDARCSLCGKGDCYGYGMAMKTTQIEKAMLCTFFSTRHVLRLLSCCMMRLKQVDQTPVY